MKTILSIAILLFLFNFSKAQRPEVPNLPPISVEAAGFSQDSLNAMDDYISDYEQNDFRGLVVIKDHRLVIEYFYNSTERMDINDIRSAGKSITALLLGIAMKEGLVTDQEQDVYSFFSKEKYPDLHEDYKQVDFLWASGNGGNHLVVVPEEELVIALTSTAYGYGYGQRRSRTILNKLFRAME